MIQRFSSLSVHEKQACFPGCPFFVFFLKSIIAETFPHLYTNGALSFYFLFPIIGQLTDKCNPFFYKLRSSSASACARSRYQPSSSSSASLEAPMPGLPAQVQHRLGIPFASQRMLQRISKLNGCKQWRAVPHYRTVVPGSRKSKNFGQTPEIDFFP